MDKEDIKFRIKFFLLFFVVTILAILVGFYLKPYLDEGYGYENISQISVAQKNNDIATCYIMLGVCVLAFLLMLRARSGK